ncbi:MAG: LCP family protein [Clostridiales bacterium]|nr:LCP family protein [Clostridiales bacterium]
MNDHNNHSNEDFEDIYSNTSSDDYDELLNEYKNTETDEYEDISSSSEEASEDDFTVKYNKSAVHGTQEEYSYDGNDLYSNSPKPREKKTTLKITALVLAIVLAIVLVIAFVIAAFFGDIDSLLGSITQGKEIKENEFIDSENLFSDANQVNILIIGVDAREGDTISRSDTMMLVTVDFVNKQIKLTSFLRDSYVDLACKNENGKEYGMNKLNAAYAYGGVQACIDTLELNFKVEIPYYVIVDFKIFETIVNDLGGLDIEVTDKEARYINSQDEMTDYEKAAFPEKIEGGMNHFDGTQTLWYARIRKCDSDFYRTKRQRKVIKIATDKAREMDLDTLESIAEKVMPMLVTNMTQKQMTDLGLKAVGSGIFSWGIAQHQIPADGTWKNSSKSVGAVLEMDLDENARLLREFLINKYEEESTTAAS